MKFSTPTIFLSLFLGSVLIFLAHYYIAGDGVWGDGRYYFAYTRSLVIDHNLDLLNESRIDPFYFDPIPTPTGKIANKYSIGTAIIWIPGFLLAHLIALISHGLGFPLIPDGYHHLYRIFIGIEAIALGIGGLYFTFKLLCRYFNFRISILSTIAIFFATHVFYYISVDPINSHPPTIFLSGLILYLIDKRTTSVTKSLVLGLLVGILAITRNQDSLFLLPALAALSHPILLLPFGFGAISAGLPEIFARLYLYGSLNSPYVYFNEGFNLAKMQILGVLFAPQTGLLSTTPILIGSLFGLIRRSPSPRISKLGLALFICQLLIIASWSNWWGGESYGARMFLSLTPFFAFGLAGVIRYTNKTITLLLISLLSLLNIFSIIKFLLLN